MAMVPPSEVHMPHDEAEHGFAHWKRPPIR
jgi:hypothetical protein